MFFGSEQPLSFYANSHDTVFILCGVCKKFVAAFLYPILAMTIKKNNRGNWNAASIVSERKNLFGVANSRETTNVNSKEGVAIHPISSENIA